LEERAPVEPILELESPVFASSPEPPVRFFAEPVVPRFLFINERETELLQIQNSRLSYNWRKRGDDYDYPRYAAIRERFERCFAKFQEFVSREKLGEIRPDQAELLYANHVEYPPGPEAHSHLGALVRPWSSSYRGLAGCALEDATIRARHVLRSETGAFLGRLHLFVQPAYLVADRTPIYKIELVGRGRPWGEGINGAFSLLDLAHTKLREGFSELIEDDVQRTWMGAFHD
jgi:hypothetical protein